MTIEELDPSLAKIVSDYQKRFVLRIELLISISNKDDVKYYKAGQIISEVDEVMTPVRMVRLKVNI